MIFNAHFEPLVFTIPPAEWSETWLKELDTHRGWLEESETVSAGRKITVQARSMVVLRGKS